MKSFIFRCGEECWIEHVSRDKNEELNMMNLVLELEDIFIYFIHISFSYMQCNATKWRVACSMGKVGSILRLMNCYHMATYDFLLPSVTSLPFFFININMKYSLIFVKINFCQKIVLVTFSNVSSVLNQLANFI